MIFPGHIAGGYLAAKAVLALTVPESTTFTSGQMTALLAAGTFAGYLPDIDMFFYFFHGRFSAVPGKYDSHRNYVTHAPLFWLVMSLFIVLAGWIGNSLFTELLGWLMLAGTWSHFLLDSLEYGIRWFWPFSAKRYALRTEMYEPHIHAPKGSIAYYLEEFSKVWNKRITFVLEIIVVLAAVLVLLR